MKMRTILLVLLVFCFATTAVAAVKEADRTAPFTQIVTPAQRDLFEGFEGDFPPTGWILSSVNGHVAPENFYQGDTSNGTPIEGDHMMVCEWDPDMVDQDNKIEFDYAITAGEDNLNFFISGSTSWIDNYDLTVEIDGTQMYSWQATYAGPSWVYEFINIDLTAYTGSTVNIAFRYTGNDGAAIYMDAVMIDDGTGWEPPPPPEAPLNDTCEGAVDNNFFIMPGAFSYSGDNTYANPDYSMPSGSCTGYSVTGLDVVWAICMDPGDVLDVTMTSGFDASFYLISDCGDPFGSCLIGADDPETFVYTATDEGLFYLICSAYSGGLGAFTIDGTFEGDGCTISTEDKNWDGLKSLYR